MRYTKTHKRLLAGLVASCLFAFALLGAVADAMDLFGDDPGTPEPSKSSQPLPFLQTTFGGRETRDLYEFLNSHVGQSVRLSVAVKADDNPEGRTPHTSTIPLPWYEQPESVRAPRTVAAGMEVGTAGFTEVNAIVVLDIDATPPEVPRCYYPSEENPFDWKIEGTFFVDKTYFQTQQLVIALRPVGK